MGRTRRLAGLLGAAAAAVSLSLGTTGPAQARALAAGGAASPAAACLPWDGTQPPPPARGGLYPLYGMAVVSACDVWVVGISLGPGPGGLDQPLIEHWTGGGSWTVVPTPALAGGRPASLFSVSAVSASSIWAVGHYDDGSFGSLVLHWDGTSWTQQDAPGVSLSGVSALPSGEAWAIGPHTILHRDGTGWSAATLPAGLDLAGLWLTSVTATSASNAWAVGATVTDPSTPVILHWDGASWTRDSLPGGTYTLYRVSASSATDAWAVGSAGLVNGNPSGGSAPVTLHWDGTSWTIIRGPDPARGTPPEAALLGVTDVSPANVWAVGNYTTGSRAPGGQPGASLMLHWNGHGWLQVPTPHPGTADELNIVAVDPAGHPWALGDTDPHRPVVYMFGTVPSVTGDSLAAATTAMNSAGLGSTITTVTTAGGDCTTATDGTITATSPPAGTFTPPARHHDLLQLPPHRHRPRRDRPARQHRPDHPDRRRAHHRQHHQR